MPKGEICPSCVHKNASADAMATYEVQPTLTALYDAGGVIYHVGRQIDPETRSKMIKDPTTASEDITAYLDTNPCDFVKTGRCAVADFAVVRLLNQQI